MKTAKTLAVFLIAGGLLGILESVLKGVHFSQQNQTIRLISSILSAALFAWGIPVGIGLWQGTLAGFKWAKLLFALQVPVFSLVHVSYELSTFLSFRVMLGDTNHYLGGNIGSSSNIYLSADPTGVIFGVNIVAVLALLYLMKASRFAPAKAH